MDDDPLVRLRSSAEQRTRGYFKLCFTVDNSRFSVHNIRQVMGCWLREQDSEYRVKPAEHILRKQYRRGCGTSSAWSGKASCRCVGGVTMKRELVGLINRGWIEDGPR